MVWEVVVPVSGNQPECHSLQEPIDHTDNADPNQSEDVLHCEEHIFSSPGFPTSDSYLEYDDLPDLQEVQEEWGSVAEPVYQVDVGVSHQEGHTSSSQPVETNWLIQLAHIATGPQSPLIQNSDRRSSSSNLHSYARPPPAAPHHSSLPSDRSNRRTHRRSRMGCECNPAQSTLSSHPDDGNMGWSLSCPPTAWHCFHKGTQLWFHGDSSMRWQNVEDLEVNEEDSDHDVMDRSLKNYGSEGLCLVEHTEVVSSGHAVLQLTFDPRTVSCPPVTVRCQLDHPFYVKNKGWSSFYPSLTVMDYGIPCYDMEVGDVCLPPGHRDAKETNDSSFFVIFKRYDFTPLESSAVYMLSSMARQRRLDGQSRVGTSSSESPASSQDAQLASHSYATCPKSTKSQHVGVRSGNCATPTKCKRPMNAFMLFAQKFRVEYTQMNPGKDNRAISILLGEQWKKMQSEERQTFTMQAKALADEQKRLNPDCWKRKRSNSDCQGNLS